MTHQEDGAFDDYITQKPLEPDRYHTISTGFLKVIVTRWRKFIKYST